MDLNLTRNWKYLRLLPMIVLLASSFVKIRFAKFIVAEDNLFDTPQLLSVVVFVELFLSMLILFASAWPSWCASAISFTGLFMISCYAYFSKVSCGCFGQSIPEGASIPINLFVLLVAWWGRPPVSSTANYKTGVAIGGAAGLFGLVALSFGSFQSPGTELDSLLASESVGTTWLLNDSLNPNLAELSKGSWLVFVVRRDCEHCQALLESRDYVEVRQDLNARCVVFIAGQSSWPFILDSTSIVSPPTGSITWPSDEPFVASPAVFLISDGFVVSASDGKDSEHFLDDLGR